MLRDYTPGRQNGTTISRYSAIRRVRRSAGVALWQRALFQPGSPREHRQHGDFLGRAWLLGHHGPQLASGNPRKERMKLPGPDPVPRCPRPKKPQRYFQAPGTLPSALQPPAATTVPESGMHQSHPDPGMGRRGTPRLRGYPDCQVAVAGQDRCVPRQAKRPQSCHIIHRYRWHHHGRAAADPGSPAPADR